MLPILFFLIALVLGPTFALVAIRTLQFLLGFEEMTPWRLVELSLASLVGSALVWYLWSVNIPIWPDGTVFYLTLFFSAVITFIVVGRFKIRLGE